MKVDFFIVGAPKSGTTSLYKYLNEHPNIFMSINIFQVILVFYFKIISIIQINRIL